MCRKKGVRKMNSIGATTNVSNNNPSFGMALKFDPNALPRVKSQALKLDSNGYDKFFKEIKEIETNQKENPVNIIVRKVRGMFSGEKLAAEVVDSNADTAVPNRVFKQSSGAKDDLEFLKSAETYANSLNETNGRIAELPLAEKTDYKPHIKVDTEDVE